MAKQRVQIEQCDAPGCEYYEVVSPEEPAQGYHLGSGFWSLAGGGPIPKTYACSKEHIVPAIEANIERAMH